MDNPNYTSNPISRCYFCKANSRHPQTHSVAARLSYVVDGVNADDLGDYRPGIQGSQERGARSPLAELASRSQNPPTLQTQDLGGTTTQPCLSSLSLREKYG